MATNDPKIFPGQLDSHQVKALQDQTNNILAGYSTGVTTTTAGTASPTVTTTASHTWSGTASPVTPVAVTQSATTDEYMHDVDKKKKKYANDLERTIDEEVARIKNL